VRCCCRSIHARLAEGSSAITHALPSGEKVRPAMASRSRGHSSAAALDSASGDEIFGNKPWGNSSGNKSGEITSIIVIARGTGIVIARGSYYRYRAGNRGLHRCVTVRVSSNRTPGGVEWSVRHVAIQLKRE